MTQLSALLSQIDSVKSFEVVWAVSRIPDSLSG